MCKSVFIGSSENINYNISMFSVSFGKLIAHSVNLFIDLLLK